MRAVGDFDIAGKRRRVAGLRHAPVIPVPAGVSSAIHMVHAEFLGSVAGERMQFLAVANQCRAQDRARADGFERKRHFAVPGPGFLAHGCAVGTRVEEDARPGGAEAAAVPERIEDGFRRQRLGVDAGQRPV